MTVEAAATHATTLEAYERWSSMYHAVPHNPLMRAEQRAMLEEWPDLNERRVLDLACGTGRYASLAVQSRSSHVVALDFADGMLRRVTSGKRVRADMSRLPFVAQSFDAVISGLALAHALDLDRWFAEIARVLSPGGVLLYSDFHTEAVRAGMTRSFKDEQDRLHIVPHHHHELAEQRTAAIKAGFKVEVMRELRVGHEFREIYPGSDALYRDWSGVPLILLMRARKGTQ